MLKHRKNISGAAALYKIVKPESCIKINEKLFLSLNTPGFTRLLTMKYYTQQGK